MELARLDQASSAPSSTKSLGLEKALPRAASGRADTPSTGSQAHTSACHSRIPQPKGSLCPTSSSSGSPSSLQVPPKATCRKEGKLSLWYFIPNRKRASALWTEWEGWVLTRREGVGLSSL